MRTFSLRIVSMILLLGSVASAAGPPEPDHYSLVRILANPAAFDGKTVRTYGFAVFKFEEAAIYLSEADATYMITENGIFIDRGKTDLPATKFDWTYVEVTGIFTSRPPGSTRMFPGAIRSVSIQPLDRRESLNGE